MSDSVRPHRRQPTRLHHPWDSPGKNIGVGCHFLMQFMKMKSENKVTQSCQTLSNPMDCSLPGSSIHAIFQARVLEWGATAFSRYGISLSKYYPSSWPNKPCLFHEAFAISRPSIIYLEFINLSLHRKGIITNTAFT